MHNIYKTHDSMICRIKQDLTPSAGKIFDLLRLGWYANSAYTRQQIARLLGLSDITVKRALTDLRKRNLAFYHTSNYRWEVMNINILLEEHQAEISKFNQDVKQAQQYRYQRTPTEKEFICDMPGTRIDRPEWVVNR